MIGVILAAGQGSRLAPLTDDRPKCMVEFNGKPIIDYIVDTMWGAGIEKIVIVDGYKNNVLREYLKDRKVVFEHNPDYASTNMVSTLFCAEKHLTQDTVISYADIVYSQSVLQDLIKDSSDFSCVVDDHWHKLWSLRMENPYEDVESMVINDSNEILELGGVHT